MPRAVKRVSVKKQVKACKKRADLFKQLGLPPKSSDSFLWCDYVEIRCLVHSDRRFSRSDLLECISELASFEITSAEGFLERAQDADFDGTNDGNGDELGEDADDIPVNDKNEAQAAALFDQLAARANLFGVAYPFALDATRQEVILIGANTAARSLYLQLLLSASLRLISNTRRMELTEEFELISENIFRGLMPVGWEVHQFGAKASTRYRGHLFARLTKLADDWRGHLKLEKRHFKTKNSGDGGLDLVAWHPLGNDGRVGLPLAAAQCGCTAEEWTLKQLEASPAKLNIDVQHHWATYYFMPQDLVEVLENGCDWQRRPDIARAIVIDRLRIVRLARDFGSDARYAQPTSAVVEACAYTYV